MCMKQSKTDELIEALEKKYSATGQDKNNCLEGLLHSKPMNYWDYIHTDALLNLQIQRTHFPDEMVFIGYHQINELIFKMILHCNATFFIFRAKSLKGTLGQQRQSGNSFQAAVLATRMDYL